MIKTILSVLLFTVSVNSYAGLFDFLGGSSYTEGCKTEGRGKVCDVYFNDEIDRPDTYQSLKKMLITLSPSDTVVLHLAGNGGDGAGLLYILNALKSSKAHVIGSLEGSIASAHTLLLVASDEIQINGDGYILFHAISGLNMVEDWCVEATGKDRGIAAYTKCVENMTAITNFYNKAVDKYNTKYLNEEERARYYKGHDIIIDSEELAKRLKGA